MRSLCPTLLVPLAECYVCPHRAWCSPPLTALLSPRADASAAAGGLGDLSDADLVRPLMEAAGVVYNSDSDAGTGEEWREVPALHTRRSGLRPGVESFIPRSASRMLRGLSTREAEDDALLEEQARGLLGSGSAGRGGGEAAAAGASSSIRGRTGGLSGDDSSDWGGDPLDLRFEQVRGEGGVRGEVDVCHHLDSQCMIVAAVVLASLYGPSPTTCVLTITTRASPFHPLHHTFHRTPSRLGVIGGGITASETPTTPLQGTCWVSCVVCVVCGCGGMRHILTGQRVYPNSVLLRLSPTSIIAPSFPPQYRPPGLGVDDELGIRLQPAFGKGLEAIPSEVLQEYATPYDFHSEDEGALYPPAGTAREAAMTHEERMLDEQRKALRPFIGNVFGDRRGRAPPRCDRFPGGGRRW